jgi:hypothetical protein
MQKIKLQLNTNDMILYHLLQRFIYQYHSLFSQHKTHPAMSEFTQLWFIKLFVDNQYFKTMSQSLLIDYDIKENKDLFIVVRAPLFYKSFLVSLEKDIKSCITFTDNEGTTEDLDIFSIEYEI